MVPVSWCAVNVAHRLRRRRQHHQALQRSYPLGPPAPLFEKLRRHAQRRALVALDDDMLKDIGLSRAEAWQEASKPFWQR